MIDFPDNPTNGDEFTAPGGITWVFEDPLWVLLATGGGGGSDGFTFIQDTVPTATAAGQTWFDTSTSTAFVWVVDVDSAQWVQYAPGSGGGGAGGAPRPADGCSLAYSVGQSIPNSAWTALTWEVVRFDTLGMHDPARPTRITITEAGRYLFNYRFSYFAAAGGTQRLGRMQKNGNAASLIGHDLGWPSGTLEAMVNGTAVLDLEVGDYLECLAFQDSGAATPTQGIQSATNLVYFEAIKLETGGGGSGGSDGFTFTQDTEPTGTTSGQTWFDTSTGNSFVWFDDGNSAQWVQFAPGGSDSGAGFFSSRTFTGLGFTTTSVAAQQVPEFTTSVTPRSVNSRFRLRAVLYVGANTNCDDTFFFLMRGLGPTVVSVGASGVNATGYYRWINNGGGLEVACIVMEFVDSPNTTEPFQYGVAMGVRVSSPVQQLFLNRRGADTSVGAVSTFTVEEIL